MASFILKGSDIAAGSDLSLFRSMAVVLDDSGLRHPQELSVRERLERMIYLSGKEQITGKYIRGQKVL